MRESAAATTAVAARHAELLAIVDGLVGGFARHLTSSAERVRRELTEDALAAALAGGPDVVGALVATRHARALGDFLARRLLRACSAARRPLARALGALLGIRIELDKIDHAAGLPAGVRRVWTHNGSRIARWARDRAADLVVEITSAERAAIREVMRQAAAQGWSVGRTAGALRDVIGLDSRYALAVERYRDELAAKGIDAVTVRRKAEEYRRALLRHRSRAIARTEMVDAVGATELELWTAARAAGLLDPGWKKRWRAVLRSGKVCKVCRGVHGQRQPLDRPFELPGGRTVPHPTAHTFCRCAMDLVHDDDTRAAPELAEFSKPRPRTLRPAA